MTPSYVKLNVIARRKNDVEQLAADVVDKIVQPVVGQDVVLRRTFIAWDRGGMVQVDGGLGDIPSELAVDVVRDIVDRIDDSPNMIDRIDKANIHIIRDFANVAFGTVNYTGWVRQVSIDEARARAAS